MVIQMNILKTDFLEILAIHKRLNHRARAPMSIPDVPDEIFYKVISFIFIGRK
jgi:hypothetical protein